MNPVVIVTGANTGIGRATARALAREGAQVFLACRSEEKTQPVLEEIRRASSQAQVEYLPLDLGDFDSIRRCAEAFLRRDLPLHVLINNAGLAGRRGLTRSGFEPAFGVTHVGHFLLTKLLLDRLKASAPARIVTVSSRAHYRAKGIDFDAVRRPAASAAGVPEYGVAKLANVLFSAELARQLAGTGVTTYSLHPGVVATDVWRTVPWPFRSLIKLFMLSVEEGARTTLYCASSPDCATETGLYYDKCKAQEPGTAAQDRALAKALWDYSERWTA
jgi:NAD(P)-dependent dehydrogenase (short-subunit alcohol dehydrogenase family)